MNFDSSYDYLFPLAEAHAAADFLNKNLFIEKWPRYYQQLMLCYNPWEYQVRYFQVQFCIINRLPFKYYRLILTLNYHVGIGELDNKLLKKLKDLYNYVLRQAESNPRSIVSYNIANDGVTDYNNNDIFRRNEMGDYFENSARPDTRFCNSRSMIDYLRNLGVYDHFLYFLR